MSYVLQYTSNFHNELNELVEIGIYKNDQTGNGLKGEYFPTPYDLTGTPILTRTDNVIDFHYRDSPGSPGPGVPEEFSVRWTGQIKPEFTGTYTIYTLNDDGVRLWIDNVLIIDDWVGHGPTENNADVSLTAGTLYDIKIEYFEGSGEGTMRLYWSAGDDLAKQIIPQRCLFAPLFDTPVNLPCTSCQVNVNGDDSDLFDPILCRELVFAVFVENGVPLDWETFIASNQDEWQVIATIDGQPLFHGFLVPDEGPSPFQDKPYEIILRCTDGLKLLEKISLSKSDGTEFDSKHTPIEYVSAILSKTNLAISIKVYSNIYNNGMFTRDSDITLDMFTQCQFDYRTFMTSATDFTNCYDALKILFKEHFRLYYWNGMWVIYRIPEYQFLPSYRYFTIYDSTGAVLTAGIDPENYAEVGKTAVIYPINENQIVSSRFANKSVKHTYKYNIWDEIPRNNKFERAALDNTVGDSTNRYYNISDWSYGKMLSAGSLPGQTSTTFKAWRKSVYDAYGVERSREIQLQTGPDGLKSLQSQSIPVNVNDKISVSFQIRLTDNIAPGDYPAMVIYIKGTTFTWYMDDDGSWKHPGGTISIEANYISAEDSTEYKSISVDSLPIPEDGDLYIAFQSNVLAGSDVYFKDFDFNYTPYVAGGYLPVVGDYWSRTQNNNVADTKSEEIQVSDAKAVFKGAFWSGPAPSLGALRVLTPQWYRYGISENRHYKELVNIGSFNLTYRRFYKIEGDFNGTGYMANNALGTIVPLSFTPRYGFIDIYFLRLFAMVCPVQMDILKGRFSATFVEVFNTDTDGSQNGDTATFNYLFE